MRIDHVAHACRDPRETHRFYTGVMGFQLVQAYGGAELLLVYAAPGGGCLAFTASQDHAPAQQSHIRWERQHVGLAVRTRAEFESWLDRLKEFSVPHRVVDDERIYFADPDGLALEIEVESPVAVDPAASDVLEHWAQTH